MDLKKWLCGTCNHVDGFNLSIAFMYCFKVNLVTLGYGERRYEVIYIRLKQCIYLVMLRVRN